MLDFTILNHKNIFEIEYNNNKLSFIYENYEKITFNNKYYNDFNLYINNNKIIIYNEIILDIELGLPLQVIKSNNIINNNWYNFFKLKKKLNLLI